MRVRLPNVEGAVLRYGSDEVGMGFMVPGRKGKYSDRKSKEKHVVNVSLKVVLYVHTTIATKQLSPTQNNAEAVVHAVH
jgi:hypothetical protein